MLAGYPLRHNAISMHIGDNSRGQKLEEERVVITLVINSNLEENIAHLQDHEF